MKKLNNKGFAISTVLYGLLIVLILITTLIIATMSSSRKSSREFTDNITRNLENVTKTDLSNQKVCENEANSIAINQFDSYSISKDKMCNNIISNVKEKYFYTCYGKGSSADYCNKFLDREGNGDFVSELYSSCNANKNSRDKIISIVIHGCCFYRNLSHSSGDYTSCINGK